ncbi:MAG TPA: DUF454 family protein [Thermoanaerobaculia bacterium]|nr:DUF454 family protein [Thermoanaerobaculia bacterium]
MESLTEPGVEELEEIAADCASPSAGPIPPPELRPPRGRRRFRALPWKTRVILAVLGAALLILGVAGLFLPFLQGILFLVLAAAVLSLASERVYGWLRDLASERWPGLWLRVERFRTRVLWKLRR